MTVLNNKEAEKRIDSLFETEAERKFIDKYLEIRESFNNYNDKILRSNIKNPNIRIEFFNNHGVIYFDTEEVRIKDNAYELIVVFVDEVIKKKKSQLLKKYDQITYDEEEEMIKVKFAHIEDIDDIILYHFNINTDNPASLYNSLNKSLSSLIEEPDVEFTRKLNFR